MSRTLFRPGKSFSEAVEALAAESTACKKCRHVSGSEFSLASIKKEQAELNCSNCLFSTITLKMSDKE